MENLIIQRSMRTPGVNFDRSNGLLELIGRSYMSNAKQFYDPIINDWLEDYLKTPVEKTILNLKLDFINTSSSLWIITLLKKLEKLNTESNVEVNWYYTDEDVFDLGREYKKLVSLPFNFFKDVTFLNN